MFLRTWHLGSLVDRALLEPVKHSASLLGHWWKVGASVGCQLRLPWGNSFSQTGSCCREGRPDGLGPQSRMCAGDRALPPPSHHRHPPSFSIGRNVIQMHMVSNFLRKFCCKWFPTQCEILIFLEIINLGEMVDAAIKHSRRTENSSYPGTVCLGFLMCRALTPRHTQREKQKSDC